MATAALDLFVSTAGDDRNPGTAPDAPLRTPERALAAAAGRRATIRLAAGRYALAAPLHLTAQHSHLTLAAADGARAVLSAGRRITGWRPAQVGGRQAWTAAVGELDFQELWVDGARRLRPRIPAPGNGLLRIAGVPDATGDTPWNRGQTRFAFAPGDIRAGWRNLRDIEAVVLHFWVDSHLPLAAVDEDAGIATTSRRSIFRLSDDYRQRGARYYLDNVFEALAPGDWYLDRPAGTLYYLPLPGEDPDAAEVVAPAGAQAVRIEGAEGVTLRGLTIGHTEWRLPADSAGFGQAAAGVPAAVALENARGCTVEGCEITHCGTYALEVGPGCTDVRVTDNRLSDLGAGGIRLAKGSAGSHVARNEIVRAGRVYHAGVGVLVLDSPGNTIADNHIHDLYYTGVSVGWVWGYGPSAARDNLVLRNHIHDVGQGMLNDMGGIYTLGMQPGTVLRGNHIHDVRSDGYGGWGIYLDEGSTDILVEDNLVYRTKTGGFHQHYGRDNRIRNNIFALAAEGQIQRSRCEEHSSFAFEGNIVYFEHGPLLHGNWKAPGASFDRNVYWDASGRPLDCGGGRSWQDWQELGMDTHSAVADPGFSDPANGDFALRPDSPALALGFRPFHAGPAGK